MMMLNNMHNAMARPNLPVSPSNITYLVSLSKNFLEWQSPMLETLVASLNE
jgi:hypothetical protein